MTISASYAPTVTTGTGANTPQSTVWTFFAATNVVVTSVVTVTGVETVLVKDTHYTLTGGGPSGTQASSVGTVTPIDGATDFPATVKWRIERSIPVLQDDYDANEGDSFSAVSVEGAFDRQVMREQEGAGRRVLLASTSGSAVPYLTITSNDWPSRHDSVCLEMIGVHGPSATVDILIRIIDNGFTTVSGLDWVAHHMQYGLDEIASGLDTAISSATSLTSFNSLRGSLYGEIVMSSRSGFYNGRGSWTSTTATAANQAIHTTLGFVKTSASTRLDGFDVAPTSLTISGTLRLWGLPRT